MAGPVITTTIVRLNNQFANNFVSAPIKVDAHFLSR